MYIYISMYNSQITEIRNHNFYIIYSLALVLFIAGHAKLFNDQVKNDSLIYFGFITILWGITVQWRYYNETKTESKGQIKVPYSIKCFFREKYCEEGDIKITWAIIHFMIYFIAGLFFRDRYLFFFIISILCEFFELYAANYNSKMFIDPIFNMFGYYLGNVVGRKYNNFF